MSGENSKQTRFTLSAVAPIPELNGDHAEGENGVEAVKTSRFSAVKVDSSNLESASEKRGRFSALKVTDESKDNDAPLEDETIDPKPTQPNSRFSTTVIKEINETSFSSENNSSGSSSPKISSTPLVTNNVQDAVETEDNRSVSISIGNVHNNGSNLSSRHSTISKNAANVSLPFHPSQVMSLLTL